MKKISIPVTPKIITIVAAAMITISCFLPWFDFGGSLTSDLEDISWLYIILGVVPAVLNLIAIITKAKLFSTLSHVFGMIASIIAIIYCVYFILGSSMIGLNDYIGYGYIISVISSIALLVGTIISMKNTKKINK